MPKILFLLASFWGTALLGFTQTLNPVGLINQPLVPTSASPGGSTFTLTVNGTGFVAGSVVNWNGNALATALVGSSQLTATVPAANIAQTGTASVSVVNPVPGGGVSNVVYFPIAGATSGVQTSATDLTTGVYDSAIAVGDFNGDGKLDLATLSQISVCGQQCEGDGFVTISTGNGDGTFAVGPPITTAFWAKAIAVGDFNRDGKLDLAIANGNAYQVATNVSILLGNGDGTFTTGSTTVGTGVTSDSVVAGDFNGDGNLDLAMTNECYSPTLQCTSSSVTIFLGNGDGTFRIGSSPLAAFGQFISAGDFNGDGKLDLVLGGGDIGILLGNGDGTFTSAVSPLTGYNTNQTAIGDFNGDGKLDLAVAISCVGAPCPYDGETKILLGSGDGTFTVGSTIQAGTAAGYVTAADFNQDGKLDLAVVSAQTVTFQLGNGDGTFSSPAPIATHQYPGGLVTGDFNGDGKLDLAVAYTCADGDCYSNFNGITSILLQAAPVLLSTTTLAFPTQPIGIASYAQPVTLYNNQAVPLTITSIAASGDFQQTNNCGTSLAAGATCVISVTFTPTARNSRTGTLTVSDSFSPSTQTVALSGTGTAVSLSTNNYHFGIQKIGTTSKPLIITLTNLDKTQLKINSITPGRDTSQFIETTTCGSVVPPSGSCKVTVIFAPTAPRTQTFTLTFQDNGGGGPQKVILSGYGN